MTAMVAASPRGARRRAAAIVALGFVVLTASPS